MVLAAGSVGQEPEGMRAVEEVQAQVSRVDRVQKEEWKVKKGWGSGNVIATGWEKRSPEKEAGRPRRGWCGIQ